MYIYIYIDIQWYDGKIVSSFFGIMLVTKPGFISSMAGKSPVTEWRFLARKMTDKWSVFYCLV